MTVRFSKLTKFPRNRLLEEDLLRCRARELDLLARFGAPTLETPASEPEPTFYWDVEWQCGLLMSMQFNQLTEMLTIRLNELDSAHALRHLGFDVTELWSLEQEAPDHARRLVTARHGDAEGGLAAPEIVLDAPDDTPSADAPVPDTSWELWQEQAAGGRAVVAVGLSRRDADCWCAELHDEPNARPCWVQQSENALPHRR